MNPTFLDANVLLEILLPGRRFAQQAERAITGKSLVISPLSVHLFVYFGGKADLPLSDLLETIDLYKLTQFGPEEVSWAIRNCQSNDFEDALQVACALLHGCTSFITFDKQLAKNYGQFIKIQTPGK